MGNRKLPFGYKMQLGEIMLHPEESACVQKIFDQYQLGASFNELVRQMKERGVPYDEGKLWNKNMIARILGDERYLGQAPYPSLIDKEQFDAAAKRRSTKQVHLETTEAQKMLRKLCGTKVTPNIEQQVLSLLNQLAGHPEYVFSSTKPSQCKAEIAKLQRKVDEALAQQPIDEEAARRLILELASAEYDSIGSAEYETERLRRLLLDAELAEELDETLLRKCVAKVLVAADKTVSLQLKNGQTIERRMLF